MCVCFCSTVTSIQCYSTYNLDSESMQFYYHHGVVTQLKNLYNSLLQPECGLTEQPIDEPSTRSEKNGSGKKDDKSGGNKSKEKAIGKEKKGNKLKDDSIREEPVTLSQGIVASSCPNCTFALQKNHIYKFLTGICLYQV